MIVFGLETGSSDMIYYSKGSVESILTACTTYQSVGAYPLDDGIIEKINTAHDQMTQEGLRVLACACGSSPSNMMFLGLVGIHDIPRPNIGKHLEKLMGMGIQIIMITGDSGEYF